MASLGSKCLVGDQLHPSGAINHDTYKSIAPAYDRIQRLEPFLEGAKQVSEIAILSAEYFSAGDGRNHPSDDGAAQMLQELKRPFDVIDEGANFEAYRLLILPDEIPAAPALAARLKTYVGQGGKIIASWHAGLDANGVFAIDAGLTRSETPVAFRPSYIKASAELDGSMPETAFVMYDEAETAAAKGATVLAEIYPPYFNRSYKHFSSHQHTPDDPAARTIGVAVSEHRGVAYIAYPIFRLYRSVGQPLYKYIVRGLLNRLIPDPALTTDLPSAGRATLTHQARENRHILHLLYGAPQVRGKDIRQDDGASRIMEMIEDVPAIGPVSAKVRLPSSPRRVYDALTGVDVPWTKVADGQIEVKLPGLHIHTALVFEGA
jgi:hypothetical protein